MIDFKEQKYTNAFDRLFQESIDALVREHAAGREGAEEQSRCIRLIEHMREYYGNEVSCAYRHVLSQEVVVYLAHKVEQEATQWQKQSSIGNCGH